ncbi:hypothetical protein N0V88_007910 [Collariella sp. IMI 366227]|nr:hypothetical protein N0V88_007910 [Collariella sp. IMI 366227]
MPADFENQSYWHDRFMSETSFEWLASSPAFLKVLAPRLQQLPSSARILHLGSGTSDLHNQLRHRGFLDVTNVDYEPLALDRGRELERNEFGNSRMKYCVADVTRLDLKEGAYHLAIDKSTADAIACGGLEAVVSMAKAIHRHLADDGVWVSLSYSSSRFDDARVQSLFEVEVVDKVPTPKAKPRNGDPDAVIRGLVPDEKLSLVGSAIASASQSLSKFVREVREARSEIQAISAELHALDGVLDLLRYDAAFFPPQLADDTPAVLDTCLDLVRELDGCFSVLNQPGVSRTDKKSLWVGNRDHIGKLRWTLGEYKSTLGLAADLVGVIKSQTIDPSYPAAPRDSLDTLCDGSDEGSDLVNLASDILTATSNLQTNLHESMALTKLGRYLRVLEGQTLAAITEAEAHHASHRRDGSSSDGGAPDSAIDVSYDDIADMSPFSNMKPAIRPSSMPIPFESWEEELEEFVGELNEMPIRPPPPPPRSASRLSSASRALVNRPGSADSSCENSPTAFNDSASRALSPIAPHRPAEAPYFTPVTELPDHTEEIFPGPETKTHSRRSSIFGQVLFAVWEHPRPEVPSPGQQTSPGLVSDRPTGVLRRSSSKLSTTFRNLGRRRPSMKSVEDPPEIPCDGVFGLPLNKSMLVAKGIASTRHGNSGSSARATREYPLCVLRCVYHIRDEGLDAPNIFALDGNQLRVAQLKEVFNSPETSYGRELDWSQFTVYDAADLILTFLSELPQPIISQSVGKRWIYLSRQATIRTARLDKGLDFWEEAFTGIRGPSRALFKLLLNLWGEIADAAEMNEMAAERLAGKVIRPLMHYWPARHHTDFMLGLAFMIRKRSEYNLAATGVERKSNAAF